MKFFAVAAALVAAVAAGGYEPAEVCSIVTVTETVTYGGHTPSAPGTGGYYPTMVATYPGSAPPYPTGTAPSVPSGTAPSGSGSYPSAYPSQFTGAASSLQMGGFVAGVGAFAALFL